MNEENIRVEDIVDAIKSRWVLIISVTLIATIISALISFFVIKPKYEANTKLFVGKEESSEQKAYSSSDVQMYQNLLKTYSDVIKTKDLVGKAINDVGINITPEQVLNSLIVTPQVGTQILVISYENTDKQLARDMVEAIANEFVKTSTELISNANVKIVESVELPNKPVSPNKKLNITIAFILGLVVGVGIAIIMELMDNTFKDKKQVENMLDVPVIGTIPNSEV